MSTLTLVETPAAPEHRAAFFDRLPSGRIVAIDVARYVALIGMVVAHVANPFAEGGGDTWWHTLVNGRASALFALLAGVSLAFMTGGSTPASGADLRRRQVGLGVRAVLVLLIGLTMGYLQTPIAIILCMYALLFGTAVPFLRLRARALLALGVVWALASSAVLYSLRTTSFAAGMGDFNPSFSALVDPLAVLKALVFTGPYPAFVWFAYVLIGAGIGRLDLRSVRPAAWLAGIGAGMVALAQVVHHLVTPATLTERQIMAKVMPQIGPDGTLPPELVDQMKAWSTGQRSDWIGYLQAMGHSGTLGDLVNTVGSALLVIGLALLLVRGGLTRIFAVVCGAGAMTLTLYVFHVANTDYRLPWINDLGEFPFWIHFAVLTVIGMIFGYLDRSGPLEKVVAVTSKRAAALTGRRSSATTPRFRA